MTKTVLSRRVFALGAGGAVLAAAMPAPPARAAQAQELRQFHNQPEDSALHKRLVQMWRAVETETGGKVKVRVFAENDHVEGSDPKALDMLRSGELDFFTLMGGLLGDVVPVANAQSIPFSFRDHAMLYGAIDGDLGDLIHKECEAKGIYMVPRGGFENGFRQITTHNREIRNVGDLAGVKLRVPKSDMYIDLFKSLGAEPEGINSIDIYGALKSGRVEGQENPLTLVDGFKLYEVQHHVSMTSHLWSGFNLLANLDRWRTLPDDVRASIGRNAVKYVRLQRTDNNTANDALQASLTMRGLVFNTPDTASFRPPLKAFYARWKDNVGAKGWALLEERVGKLG
jgi:tripartite ATP-independent transporter DctP family solute receptor